VLKGEAARGEKTKIAVFGFSYKQNTSDTRDTPAASIVAAFAKWGFEVAVHDPQVTQAGFEIEMHAQGYGRLVAGSEENNDSGNQELRGSVELVGADKIKACTGASAVVILTEWEIFKTYDYRELVEVMGSKGSRTLYDFRGILPDEVFSSKESPFDRSF